MSPAGSKNAPEGVGAGSNRARTQKDLADRLGLDEQKIQDYEATDYQRASFARIREIVRALEIEIREEVKL